MPTIDPGSLLAVLGPLFLVGGAARWLAARTLVPQARTWLLIGAIFSAVAWWLVWHPVAAA